MSGVIAATILLLTPTKDPALAFVAVGMILAPGVPLINSISDLAGGHPLIGLSRLATGVITVLAIGFSIFLAAYSMGKPLPVSIRTEAIPLWQDLIFSGIAAFGFALLFSAPPRAVIACIVCGTVTHGLRTELASFGWNIATATLVCAFVAGMLAQISSCVFSLPWPTFAFPGTVAMIPGSYAFRAGLGGIQIMTDGADASAALMGETVSLTISAVVLTACVSIGLLLATTIARATALRPWN